MRVGELTQCLCEHPPGQCPTDWPPFFHWLGADAHDTAKEAECLRVLRREEPEEPADG